MASSAIGSRLFAERTARQASASRSGGCAGDDLAVKRTGDSTVTTSSRTPSSGGDRLRRAIGVGIGHGFEQFGEPIVVTESDGTRLITLDHRPALDVYLERLGAPPEEYTDASTWRRFALLFGLQRPRGHEVRCVRGANYEDRSLLCPDVPQGTLVNTSARETRTP